MRELQPDKLNVELSPCLSIRYREMRFVQPIARLRVARFSLSHFPCSSAVTGKVGLRISMGSVFSQRKWNKKRASPVTLSKCKDA